VAVAPSLSAFYRSNILLAPAPKAIQKSFYPAYLCVCLGYFAKVKTHTHTHTKPNLFLKFVEKKN